MKTVILCALAALLMTGCSQQDDMADPGVEEIPGQLATASEDSPRRWYDQASLSLGERVFAENCAVCHGLRGEGHPQWRQLGPDGKLPPPPLNGSGHAWHHPLKALFQVIKHGSPGGEGNMPSWREKLTDTEIVAVIAWFQSNWSDRIYSAWLTREQASRAQTGR